MNPTVYPMALDLAGRRCLVAGGGTLAHEKVEGLLRAGAMVTVVSPTLTAGIVRLAEEGSIEFQQRPFRSSDLDGVFLAYGAD